MMRTLSVLVLLIVGLQFALAQTSTKCNPLDATCPADKGSVDSTISYDFTNDASLNDWDTITGNVRTGSNGAEFTINKQGDHPTIQTNFYIFYGEVSIEMKASPGTGIVSSLMMESDDLDEVDWEVLGGFADKLQTDYFGKGDTSTYDRSTWASAAAPQSTFHKYTWTWTESQIIWSIDGQAVRTLPYAEAKGGTRFPQTPMRVRIGIWAGGDPSNREGTITWAGGLTEYSQAPFTMYVKSVNINNYNPAKSYSYSDNSGSSKSIKLDGATPQGQKPSPSESSSSTISSSSSTFSTSTSSSSSTLSTTTSSVADTSSSTTSFTTSSSAISPPTTSSYTTSTVAGTSSSTETSLTHTTASTGKAAESTTAGSTLAVTPHTHVSIASTDTKTTLMSTPTSASNHAVTLTLQPNNTTLSTPSAMGGVKTASANKAHGILGISMFDWVVLVLVAIVAMFA